MRQRWREQGQRLSDTLTAAAGSVETALLHERLGAHATQQPTDPRAIG